MTGRDATTTAHVAHETRTRIAFYASTPAYRSVLDLHGWSDRGERLTRLSRAGDWEAMPGVVDDDMLDAFAIRAEPDQVAAAVSERWRGLVDRVALYTAADPDMLERWRCRAIAREPAGWSWSLAVLE